MLTALRLIGLFNAAIWFGAGLFFTLGIGPAVFSPEMKAVFPDYYVGTVAQILISRYFALHMICGCIAVAHYVAETVYTRRAFRKWSAVIVGVPLVLGLIGGFALQPRMRTLFQAKYRGATAEQRADATRTFGILHGVSQTMNLITLILVATWTWRVANPPETTRFVSAQKFRG